MTARSVRTAEVAGQRVLVRADLNVPLDGTRVADDTRIRASLPTLRLLLEAGVAQVLVCSHLGRPKSGPEAAFSLQPVAAKLGELLGIAVGFAGDGTGASTAVGPERVVVLENTRFHPGETKNDAGYAAELAALADVYVNDAFGSAHRAHSSTEAVAHLLPAYAGLLLERELVELGKLLGEVERPFVIVSGGSKVADKVAVLQHLGARADAVLIGGKMAEDVRGENPFSFPVVLPSDVVAAASFAEDAEARVATVDAIPEGWLGLDIGPASREEFARHIATAKTVFWNGPMGVFEWPRFAEGTNAVARAVADCDGLTVVGGGDSVRAIEESGLADRVTWVSTGGGASLELLEGRVLPGVAAIPSA